MRSILSFYAEKGQPYIYDTLSSAAGHETEESIKETILILIQKTKFVNTFFRPILLRFFYNFYFCGTEYRRFFL